MYLPYLYLAYHIRSTPQAPYLDSVGSILEQEGPSEAVTHNDVMLKKQDTPVVVQILTYLERGERGEVCDLCILCC